MMYRRIVIALMLFLSSNISFGQTVKKFKLISDIQQDVLFRGCDTLYYTNQIKSDVLDSTIRIIASKKSFSLDPLYAGKQTQSFVITSTEQAYLIQELNKLKVFKWSKGMFLKSRCLSIKQTNAVFTNNEKSKEAISRYCPIIYTFSKPIFLRNNSICLYLKQEQYGIDNTQLSYNFYWKENEYWEEYADVYINMGNYEGEPEEEQKVAVKEDVVQVSTPDIGKIFNDSSTTKRVKFGKDVLIALKSSRIDSLKILFPTLKQSIKIDQAKGGNPKIIKKDDLKELNLNHELVLNMSVSMCGSVLEKAKVLKIDWSKVVLDNVDKQEKFYPANTKYKGGPITMVSMDILFSEGQHKYLINISQALFIDNYWKINGYMELKEVK